jgi:amino acid permease
VAKERFVGVWVVEPPKHPQIPWLSWEFPKTPLSPSSRICYNCFAMETQTTNLETTDKLSDDPMSEGQKDQKATIIGITIGALVILAALIAFAVFLLTGNNDTTAKIRDVFIIFMALESLVIGLVLIVLVVQLARLTNLLQNEIKPILDSTNETVSTLRGTTKFLSDNLAEPVIKLNEYFAGLQSFLKLVRPALKNKQK